MRMKLFAAALIAGVALSGSAFAQIVSAPAAPCDAFGTASGTCAQGGVISAGGPTGSATVAPIITYNAAGQLTAVTSATVTPAVGSVTGLGSGVATALGNAIDATGGVVSQTGPATWAPIDSSGAMLSFTVSGASYTKLGNMVFAYANITFPVTADGTAIKIGGLPFAVANQLYAVIPQPVSQSGTLAFPIVQIPNRGTSNTGFYNQFTQAPIVNSTLSGQNILFIVIYPAA